MNMKRKYFIALVCAMTVLALLPAAALALTQAEWDQWSYSKTSKSTTLYAIENADVATSTDLAAMQAIGSLPAGTYVRMGASNSSLGMCQISYYSVGSRSSAWVYSSCVTDASRTITFTDGTSITVSEALANDASALKAFLKEVWPDKSLPGDDTPQEDSSREESSQGSTSASTKKYSSDPKVIRKDYTGPQIEQLGLLTAIVRENGENREVATADLILESVEPEYQLAIIHAPRSGKCTLREKPSEKSDMVKNCKTGRVVIVLEWSEKFTRILYNNAEGYVLTSCLRFFPTDAPVLGTGVLSWEGKATGRTKINIRSAANKSSKKIDEWKTGTEVIVFSLEEDWYEIEYQGQHGFVMKEYLTMQE